MASPAKEKEGFYFFTRWIPLPSHSISGGPVNGPRNTMVPTSEFNRATMNQIERPDQYQEHLDVEYVGPSLTAIAGDGSGGGLRLGGGRVLWGRRRWYKFSGSESPHGLDT